MKRMAIKANCALALAVAGILAAAPALAEKPSWAGAGKGAKNEQGEKSVHHKSGQRDGDERSSHHPAGPATGERFGERHRTAAQGYYDEQFRSGRCPPGLAKKHNGCMPPGQAKKWSVGQPLPQDITYYEVPRALVVQFGQPPTGYRYVRVANDILLMSLATRMVTDVIQNLGRS